MKIIQSTKTSLILVLAAFIITSCARGLTSEDVPAVVRSAFAKTYPNAIDVEWDAEDGKYEAEFKLDGKEIGATYLPNAEFYEVEQDVSENDLPSAVQMAIKEDFGTEIDFSELEMLVRSGKTSYEVEFKAKGKKHELRFSEQGEIL